MTHDAILVTYNDKEYKLIPYKEPGRCKFCALDRWESIVCEIKMKDDINCIHPIKGYWKETFRSKWKSFVKNNIVDDYPYDESHCDVRYTG
jgi:hypothetical protein